MFAYYLRIGYKYLTSKRIYEPNIINFLLGGKGLVIEGWTNVHASIMEVRFLYPIAGSNVHLIWEFLTFRRCLKARKSEKCLHRFVIKKIHVSQKKEWNVPYICAIYFIKKYLYLEHCKEKHCLLDRKCTYVVAGTRERFTPLSWMSSARGRQKEVRADGIYHRIGFSFSFAGRYSSGRTDTLGKSLIVVRLNTNRVHIIYLFT